MRRADPPPRLQHLANVCRQLTGRPRHIAPEGPDGQPGPGRTATVANSVTDPVFAVVSQPTVQLDEHLLLVVRDVVDPDPADGHDRLAASVRQPVRALDVSEVAELHGTLSAARHVTQHVLQEPTPTMT